MADPTIDQLVAIAQQDEDFVALAVEFEKFHALQEQPAWVALKAHVEQTLNIHADQLARVILSGKGVINQREIDRLRGIREGMMALLELPGKIDADFDRKVERAWRHAFQVALSDEHEQEA
ncbi:MAG TPA: hypothetical protein PK413_21970 [Thermoanaerobaculia bacterium]|nr:hypothetical protein [Thermoanaerobaculia bacterium]